MGSEMCIRDSPCSLNRWLPKARLRRREEGMSAAKTNEWISSSDLITRQGTVTVAGYSCSDAYATYNQANVFTFLFIGQRDQFQCGMGGSCDLSINKNADPSQAKSVITYMKLSGSFVGIMPVKLCCFIISFDGGFP